MLLPKPTSAKVLVRRTLAQNVGGVADLYGAVVTGVGDEGEAAVDQDRKAVVKQRKVVYRASFSSA
jgi:hypothetical protein